MNRRRCLALLAAGVLTPAVALAEPTAAAPVMPEHVSPLVDIGVMMILARDEPGKIDARLTSLLPSLQQLPFASYRFLDQRSVRLGGGTSREFELTVHSTLTVHLISHDQKEARVRIQMTKDQQQILDATVRVHRDRSFVLAVQGYEGGTLLVPVSVKY